MRSPRKALPLDHLYDRVRWKHMRRDQLLRFPICQMCEAQGRLTPATIADHIEPHRGSVNAFYCNALQSLCRQCHGAEKHVIELHGFSDRMGPDGLPTDPHHPFFTGTNHPDPLGSEGGSR
jgi:hypothetical protein